ncbi:hypothetical protein USB125703_00733 [Pseudoclavibacter triregionum]|nr:hypothetical protein USB125703_00733 [Pseudoclavibacter triregionum]
MSEAAEVYARFREVFGGRTTSLRARLRRAKELEDPQDGEASLPFGSGRDPLGVGAVLDRVITTHAWKEPLAQAAVLSDWAELVGPEIASHAEPLHVEEGVLLVQCDSTAWATQLRTLRSSLVTTIAAKHPDAGVESIRFLNPGAPSWKRGLRSVPGRGPRDTYG